MLKKHFKWDITGKCNLRCKHCLTGEKYSRMKELGHNELNHGQRLDVIDRLREGGVHLINLLGGEPLMLGNDLFEIMRYSSDKDVRMTLNTNGIMLDDRKAMALRNSGCKGVTVSIEGSTPEVHDAVRGRKTFVKTITNLKRLAAMNLFDRDFSLTINTVLNRNNMHNIEEILRLCLSLKAHKWIVLPLVITGFASENKDELELTMDDRINAAARLASIINGNSKNYSGMEIDLQFSYPPMRKLIEHRTGFSYSRTQHCCMAGTTLGFLDPYGYVFPCDRIAGDFSSVKINGLSVEPMSLLEYDFAEIWNRPFYNELFTFVSSSDAFNNYIPCRRCEYLKYGLCIPCPLYGLRYEKIVYDFCIQAEKEIGMSALKLEDSEQKRAFPYSGQFELTKRERIGTTIPENRNWLESMTVQKALWVRENIQENAAELYNSYSDSFFELNYLGKEIWCRIDAESSVSGILKQISLGVPNVSRKRIYDSGLALINQLLNKNLIAIKNDNPVER